MNPRNFLRKVLATGQNDCFSNFQTQEFIKWGFIYYSPPSRFGFKVRSLKVFDLKFKYIKTILLSVLSAIVFWLLQTIYF